MQSYYYVTIRSPDHLFKALNVKPEISKVRNFIKGLGKIGCLLRVARFKLSRVGREQKALLALWMKIGCQKEYLAKVNPSAIIYVWLHELNFDHLKLMVFEVLSLWYHSPEQPFACSLQFPVSLSISSLSRTKASDCCLSQLFGRWRARAPYFSDGLRHGNLKILVWHGLTQR
jgi:hypothetical protein